MLHTTEVPASELEAGDRARMPEGRMFYPLADVRADDGQIVADAGWGTCRLDPDELVEVERVAPAEPGSDACVDCLRHGALLAAAAPYIERHYTAETAARTGMVGKDLLANVPAKQLTQMQEQLEPLGEIDLLHGIAAAGCWAICRHSEHYPEQLRSLGLLGQDGPAVLYGRGDKGLLSDLDGSVAIVGARRASSYGRDVARQLGRDVANGGGVVISGLAFGIDACAHRGALEEGQTIAVLGCGPDVAYPAAHRSLWRRVQEKGLVISELPPGTGAWRWAFPARSRIVAALAEATVVVEAAEGSGALVAASVADKLTRTVGAVPGPVNARTSNAPNRLLAEGARVVRSAADLAY